MAPSICVTIDCGEPRRKGSPRFCEECWLAAQPINVRVAAAETRMAAMPEILRMSRVPERLWPAGRRWCSGCQTFVRLTDCPKSGARCKTCASVAAHRGHIQRTYALTSEEYRALLVAQGGRCYICQRVARSKRLAVDHDHETGEVRGLLCADSERGCNHAILGNIRDLAMAKRIVAYLEDPPARNVLKRLDN